MSLPTQESFPRVESQDGLLRWAKAVIAFFNRHLPVWVMPSNNITLQNGLNNDIDLGAGMLVHVLGPTGNYTITGIGGGSEGRTLALHNHVDMVTMTIAEESTSSQEPNRINTHGMGDITPSAVLLIYSDRMKRWLLFSAA